MASAEITPPAHAVGKGARTWALARRHPMAAIGVLILAVYVLAALFGPLLVGDPLKTSPGEALAAPSADHLFGTDRFGRDVFTRAVVAARLDVVVGLVIAVIAAIAGSVVGVMAAVLR